MSDKSNHDNRSRWDRDDSSTADDLGAIRALLLAIVRHHSIEIPKEVTPLVRISMDHVDPKGSRYNEDETIDYHIRQLLVLKRMGLGLASLGSQIDLHVQSVARRDLGVDVSTVLSWSINLPSVLHHGNVDYGEFGYDENGYVVPFDTGDNPQLGLRSVRQTNLTYSPPPSRLDIREHIFKKREGQILSSPWARQRFGKELYIGMYGRYEDGIDPFVIAQLYLSDADDTSATSHDSHSAASSRQRLATDFSSQFTGKWEPSRHSWGSSDHRRSSDDGWGTLMAFSKPRREDVVFQYHMRVFTTQSGLPRKSPGLQRDSGTLTVPGDSKRNLDIYEIRYAVGLKTTWELDLPVFSLVTMTDSFPVTGLDDLVQLWDTNTWTTAGIHPSIRATGVAAYAFRIRSMLPGWEAQWSRLLGEIDRVLRANLAHILSPDRRREIIVDGSDLRLSEFYPAVLQILRIAADWIQESMDDLQWMVDDMERLYFSPNTSRFVTFLPLEDEPKAQEAAIQVFRQNWESVRSHQQRLGKALLAHITRTQETVESLKDGMFNATSVNEATKSTQLNHYILVFTIVTIFYLPLSFIAALFALGLFDWNDPKQTKSFVVTILSVAGGTYVFSGLLIWFSRQPARWRVLTHAFSSMGR